ncbi:MAG: serine hydrolase [Gemmatimonadetes bacterium]|nr:serine hydrolase [Gemmatimonadota bacterium]
MRRAVPWLSLFVLIAPTTATAQYSSAAPEVSDRTEAANPLEANGFEAFVEGLLDEWKVPGVAVGAVKDGEVVLLEGYGYRNLEDQEPITPQSILAIGSNSKSFTVVLMAQLVDEGRLDWDAPVKAYLPDFQLYDDYATENMRVKDLVTHVSGLPRHDVLWFGRSLTREELFQRLRHLEPTTTFRGRWQYQNLMFMTAGYLVERIAGRSWDDLVAERIFEPLNMTRSNTSVSKTPMAGDFSYPYQLVDDELKRIPFRNIDNVGPAGSINSSVEEMVRYIQMNIDYGLWEGTRILSEGNSKLMQSPQSVVTGEMPDPELGPSTYGFALRVSSYRGHKWVQHGGGIDGFISAMAWLPNDNIGVMVLSNMSGGANPVPGLIVQRVFDDLLELEPIDWNSRTRERIAEARAEEQAEQTALRENRVAGTSPTLDLESYIGRYSHPAHGDIEVRVHEGRLSVTLDQFTFWLTHYHYDVFQIDAQETIVPFEGRAQFRMDKEGQVASLLLPLEPALPDLVFVRKSN